MKMTNGMAVKLQGICLLIAWMGSGCWRDNTATLSPDTVTQKRASASQELMELPREMTLVEVDVDSYEQVLEKYQGRVVLVGFWSIFCDRCLELFPYTVELSREFVADGLVVITVCADELEKRTEIMNFLQDQKIRGDHLITHYSSAEFSEVFDVESGAFPHYKMYDRRGELRKELSNTSATSRFSLEDVQREVTELLAEPTFPVDSRG